MSFTMEPMIKFNALAYFPAKVMEIVDVFDALTDPNRKYRKPLSSDEALDFMQRQFIDEELKLDPILFDLFRTFTKETAGLLKQENRPCWINLIGQNAYPSADNVATISRKSSTIWSPSARLITLSPIWTVGPLSHCSLQKVACTS